LDGRESPELRKILSSDCFVVLSAESFTKSGGVEATHTMTILRYHCLRTVSLGLRLDSKVRITGLLRGLIDIQCQGWEHYTTISPYAAVEAVPII